MKKTLVIFNANREKIGIIQIDGERISIKIAKSEEAIVIEIEKFLKDVIEKGILKRKSIKKGDMIVETSEIIKAGDENFYLFLKDEINKRSFANKRFFALPVQEKNTSCGGVK